MKFIVLRNNLIEALGSLERAVSTQGSLPILSNILIELDQNKITLTTTNLEIGIRYLLQGKIIEKGSVTVPFSVFNSIVRNLNTERVLIEKKEERLLVTTDNYEASIQTQDPKEFPIIPSIQNQDQCIRIPAGLFRECLSNVVVATQYSEVRPEISGIFLSFHEKSIYFVATDSFRLAERILYQSAPISLPPDASCIIPLKTATELTKIFHKDDEEVKICLDPHQILFQTETQHVISRLVDGRYPDYQAIIPKQFKTEVLLNRQEFIDAVKLSSAFSGRASDITIRVHENSKCLEFYSSDTTLGENKCRVSAKIKGDPFSVIFNWKYLVDGLKVYRGEEISLSLNHAPDKPGPAVLRSMNEPYLLYILMPIRG